MNLPFDYACVVISTSTIITVCTGYVFSQHLTIYFIVSTGNDGLLMDILHHPPGTGATKFKTQVIIMELQKRLLVKKSTLPGAGKGLFAKQFIKKGSLIVEYKGDITTWKKIQDNETFNGYVFYVNRNHVIDARLDISAIGRYANDARGAVKITGLKNNAAYDIKNKKVFIKAIADINSGDEILVSYGKEYWDVIKYNQSIDTATKKTISKKRA